MPCYKITDPKNGDTKTSGVQFTVTFEAPCNDTALSVNGAVPGSPLAAVAVGLIQKTTDAPTVCLNDCVYTVTMTVSLPCPCEPQQATITLYSGGVPQDSVNITVVCP